MHPTTHTLSNVFFLILELAEWIVCRIVVTLDSELNQSVSAREIIIAKEECR
jgi:hypothetical protein